MIAKIRCGVGMYLVALLGLVGQSSAAGERLVPVSGDAFVPAPGATGPSLGYLNGIVFNLSATNSANVEAPVGYHNGSARAYVSVRGNGSSVSCTLTARKADTGEIATPYTSALAVEAGKTSTITLFIGIGRSGDVPLPGKYFYTVACTLPKAVNGVYAGVLGVRPDR